GRNILPCISILCILDCIFSTGPAFMLPLTAEENFYTTFMNKLEELVLILFLPAGSSVTRSKL
uniref:Uncharacterized protein n=1 Tax=Melopsittacus undulatus TaxID=13146 RepID=A0A8C6NAQ5_MELUD